MKDTKKRLILKNKKKRKTYKNKIKKRKTYKKKTYRRKKLKRKFVGGVNINFSGNDKSPQNIHIIANIAGNIQDITGHIEDLFTEVGFGEEEDEDEDEPPNFSQLERAFKTGLLNSNLGITQHDNSKLEIKIYTVDDKTPQKLVYTTGNRKQGDNFLTKNTDYFIVPNEDVDKIKAAITDPVHGYLFNIAVSNVGAQNERARHNYPGTRGLDLFNRVEDAEELAQKQLIKQLDERIQSLNKALAGLSKDNTPSREMVNSLIDNLKGRRILEVEKLTGNSPVISREPSSISTDEQRAEEIQPVPASLMGEVTSQLADLNIEGNGPAEEKSDDRAAWPAEYEPEATPEQIKSWMYWDSDGEIPEYPPAAEFIDLPEENVSRDKRSAEDDSGDDLAPATKKQKKIIKKEVRKQDIGKKTGNKN